jgi:hypothetical protein
MIVFTYGGKVGVRVWGKARLGRAFAYPYIAAGGLVIEGVSGHAPFVVKTKIRNVPRLTKIWLVVAGSIAIPCIKTSGNIVEVNDGIPSVFCYVQADRSVFVPGLDPSNDPFFYEDTEKRVPGESFIEIRE